MRRRVAFLGKSSFLAGWVVASTLTTLYERGYWPFGFWGAVAASAVVGYAMAKTVDALAGRVMHDRDREVGS